MKRNLEKSLTAIFVALSIACVGAFEEPIYTVTTSGEGTNDLDSATV